MRRGSSSWIIYMILFQFEDGLDGTEADAVAITQEFTFDAFVVNVESVRGAEVTNFVTFSFIRFDRGVFTGNGFIIEVDIIFGVRADGREIFFNEEGGVSEDATRDLNFTAIGHLVVGAIGQSA